MVSLLHALIILFLCPASLRTCRLQTRYVARMLHDATPECSVLVYYHETVGNITYNTRVCKLTSRAVRHVVLHFLQFVHGKTLLAALATSGRQLILISTLKFSSLKFAHELLPEGCWLSITCVQFNFLAFIQFSELITWMCYKLDPPTYKEVHGCCASY